MKAIYHWFTKSLDDSPQAPVEIIALRCTGAAVISALTIITALTAPRPGFDGRGLAVLVGILVMAVSGVIAVVLTNRSREEATAVQGQLLAALIGVIVGADVLAAAQPNGFWSAGPYFVAIIAAGRFSWRGGLALLAVALAGPLIGSLVLGHVGTAVSLPLGTIPWFLVMRLMFELRLQRDALETSHEELTASRAAHARAATAAERGRLAREMHDVLAHSLSALALSLESTRLLARDRGTDDEVVRAIDRAHHLAATGLDDARRAIAAARGEELPGPERIGALAEAFGEQSGLRVEVDVSGEPRALAPDARLAIYRTAQEALTNVRRHAAAERVDVRLEYRSGETVLVVEDHGPAGTPPPVAVGVGGGGIGGGGIGGAGFGLTGMRERAALLGGELHTEPTRDGFRVELRLPQ
jgi:signal transduction histidine kinase